MGREIENGKAEKGEEPDLVIVEEGGDLGFKMLPGAEVKCRTLPAGVGILTRLLEVALFLSSSIWATFMPDPVPLAPIIRAQI